MPIGFPSTSPAATPSATRIPSGASKPPQPQRHAGIGQREQGHDAERNHPVQRVLESEERRLHLLREPLQVLDGGLVVRVSQRRGAFLVDRPQSAQASDVPGGESAPRRCGCGPGSSSRAAPRQSSRGCPRSRPRPRGRGRSRRTPTDGEPPRGLRRSRGGRSRAASGQRAPRDAARVEEGDHEHRADVVDDRERGEEHLERPPARGRPSRASTPSANAMSVAMGTPQPGAPGPPAVERGVEQRPARPFRRARRRSAAPPVGRDASSPASISRLISSPTRKKNTAMRPSLIR